MGILVTQQNRQTANKGANRVSVRNHRLSTHLVPGMVQSVWNLVSSQIHKAALEEDGFRNWKYGTLKTAEVLAKWKDKLHRIGSNLYTLHHLAFLYILTEKHRTSIGFRKQWTRFSKVETTFADATQTSMVGSRNRHKWSRILPLWSRRLICWQKCSLLLDVF